MLEFHDVQPPYRALQHLVGRVTEPEAAQQHPIGAVREPAELSLADRFGRVHGKSSVDDQLVDRSGGGRSATQYNLAPDGLRPGNDHRLFHGVIVEIWKDRAVARARKQSTTGDLVRSLAVILIPLAVITVLFTKLPKDHPVQVVDPRPVLSKARTESPYPVLAPANLPSQWRATRVTWVRTGAPYLNGAPSVRNLWRVGYLTPPEDYLSGAPGDPGPDEFISAETREGAVDGESTVNGDIWERRVSADGRLALIFSAARVATIVSAGRVPGGADPGSSTVQPLLADGCEPLTAFPQ